MPPGRHVQAARHVPAARRIDTCRACATCQACASCCRLFYPHLAAADLALFELAGVLAGRADVALAGIVQPVVEPVVLGRLALESLHLQPADLAKLLVRLAGLQAQQHSSVTTMYTCSDKAQWREEMLAE
eukprot:GHRQ01036894.1.p1 GENE.GHRQ01036894.1~~GHRQ01036894.1.p1  ORF type:complete len:130 (+),score=11.67 GHRQ01036894.1:207-596(+)